VAVAAVVAAAVVEVVAVVAAIVTAKAAGATSTRKPVLGTRHSAPGGFIPAGSRLYFAGVFSREPITTAAT
jgi:hypothetical protein